MVDTGPSALERRTAGSARSFSCVVAAAVRPLAVVALTSNSSRNRSFIRLARRACTYGRHCDIPDCWRTVHIGSFLCKADFSS